MRALTSTLSLTGLLLTAAVFGQLGVPSAGAPASLAPAPAREGRVADPPAPAPGASVDAAATALPADSFVPAPTAGTPDADDTPYYAAGSQYTARYDQTRNTWQMLPVDGADLLIDAGDCSTGATASRGVWLLVQDGDGRAELVAPSTTRLAAGAADHVALRDCAHASGRELAVPPRVLTLLTANTGAIYVDD